MLMSYDRSLRQMPFECHSRSDLISLSLRLMNYHVINIHNWKKLFAEIISHDFPFVFVAIALWLVTNNNWQMDNKTVFCL